MHLDGTKETEYVKFWGEERREGACNGMGKTGRCFFPSLLVYVLQPGWLPSLPPSFVSVTFVGGKIFFFSSREFSRIE